jgi:outer membrane protein W
MRTLGIATLLLSGLAGGSTALAVEATRPIRLEIGGGALVAGSDATVDIGGSDVSIDTGVGPALSVGAGYALIDHLEVGATFHAASTDAELFAEDVSYVALTPYLRYYPLARAVIVRPWLAVGGGWYRAHADLGTFSFSGNDPDDDRTEDGGGMNFAGGLDVPIGRRVSVGADLRYHQTLGIFDDPGFLTTMVNVGVYFGGTD